MKESQFPEIEIFDLILGNIFEISGVSAAALQGTATTRQLYKPLLVAPRFYFKNSIQALGNYRVSSEFACYLRGYK